MNIEIFDTFEYKIEFIYSPSYPGLEAIFNDLGKDGWEYIKNFDDKHYLFKRKIIKNSI